jgi:hypothetical protein
VRDLISRRGGFGAIALLLAMVACGQNYSKDPVDQALAARGLKPVQAMESPVAQVGVRSDGAEMVSLGGLRAHVPRGWRPARPAIALRRAEFHMAGPGSSGGAVLAVFYFSLGQGGETAADIAHWIHQFEAASGDARTEPDRSERSVNGMHVTTVEVSGTYTDTEMSHMENRTDFTLLGAIVEAPSGRFFFKLVGPRLTVARWRAAFYEFLGSLVPE